MVPKGSIVDNLKSLDRYYRKATSPKASLFYSKLALIELCGWIEESMDDIVKRHAKRELVDPKSIKQVESSVKRVHGFLYHDHFRRMLIDLVGLIGVERLERKMDPSTKAQFEAVLSALKTSRDSEAHTHIKGVTRQINAPSWSMAQVEYVHAGLVEVDRQLRGGKK